MRRTTLLRGLGVVVAMLLVLGFAADAYAQSFFDSLPSIQGLDSAAFAGDTVIRDHTGTIILADVGNHGDHRLAVKLKDVSPVAIQATVAMGLEKSGRLITGAAAIMVAVFLAFGLADVVIIKAIGIALALAVAIDATIVRILIVPSIMRILGRANWLAPRPLTRLHTRIGAGESRLAASVPARS